MEMYANALKEDFDLNVVSFGTNIYVLYQSIKSLNSQFGSDSTSTLEMLKSILKERKLKLDEIKNSEELAEINSDLKILEDKFPYIYLLFDLEMQDNHFEIIKYLHLATNIFFDILEKMNQKIIKKSLV